MGKTRECILKFKANLYDINFHHIFDEGKPEFQPFLSFINYFKNENYFDIAY